MTRRSFNAIRIAHFAHAIMRSRRAASGVEYGFILALIVLVMFVALAQMADVTQAIWSRIATRVTEAATAR